MSARCASRPFPRAASIAASDVSTQTTSGAAIIAGQHGVAAARVQHPARTNLGDRAEEQTPLVAVVTNPPGPVEPAQGEPVERGVLARDELGSIDAMHVAAQPFEAARASSA